jgi:uncharacterized membrane protein YphA (DoxX/SURF4 family)
MLISYEILFFLARLFLALYFVIGGCFDLYLRHDALNLMQQKKIPLRRVLLTGAIALKIIFGLALIFGLHIKIAALILALFTLTANIIFHNFWAAEGKKKIFEASNFLVNLAVIGGLLLIVIA